MNAGTVYRKLSAANVIWGGLIDELKSQVRASDPDDVLVPCALPPALSLLSDKVDALGDTCFRDEKPCPYMHSDGHPVCDSYAVRRAMCEAAGVVEPTPCPAIRMTRYCEG